MTDEKKQDVFLDPDDEDAPLDESGDDDEAPDDDVPMPESGDPSPYQEDDPSTSPE